MPDLPVMLKVSGWPVVVIGGGPVALRRAWALIEAGANVTVIAPAIDDAFDSLGVTLLRREYQPGDLNGARLVVIATDSPQVNAQVAADAASAGALVNRADDPDAGDFAVPAHQHLGPITVAVSTAGISARAAAAIRDELLTHLDPAWIKLLTIIQPFRHQLQAQVPDAAARNQALRSLVDAEAMTLLKRDGPDALRQRCETIVAAVGSAPRTTTPDARN